MEDDTTAHEEVIQTAYYPWVLVVAAVVSALIAGGAVYVWQNAVARSAEMALQQQITQMQNQINQLQQASQEAPAADQDEEIQQSNPDTSTDALNTSGLVTYTDKIYGWSFAYLPKDWWVNESDNGIALHSVSTTARGVSSATISFSTVKKAEFTPVNTKVGNISYDLSQDALIDTSGGATRCLSPRLDNTPNPDLAIFEYGASLMSTPAYFWDAVMTDGDYLILVKAESDMYTDKENPNKIFSTLKLRDGVRSLVPACAQNE